MHRCNLIAPAKINLYLEILGDRPDGFHELAMVMQTVSLGDRVEVALQGTQEIQVLCNHPDVPQDQSNLAYRAAALMERSFPSAYHRYGGVRITIDKRIPIGAGLAGGSSNAAAVLVGLDLLWNLGLTKGELQDLGATLGSDVPFCIAGGTLLATGRGEQLSPLPDLDGVPLVLAKYRSLSVSTVWAYKTYRQNFGETYRSPGDEFKHRHHEVQSGPMVAAIAQKNCTDIAAHLHNDLEKVVLPQHPAVQRLRDAFAQQPEVIGTMMSGSGPTVFALCPSRDQAKTIAAKVKTAIADPDLEVWVTQSSPLGVHLEPEQK
ncbi:MAG: 4-(cytidine 5'-diphospho)-2-C-methyl-D-erythritol kinase [Prochlorotrichaceae cyanobacterium]